MDQLSVVGTTDGLVPSRGRAGRNPQGANGMASELDVIARLLRLGHKVAVPVVDDDGVDLIVDYRTTVRVKMSSAFRVADGPNPEKYTYNVFKSPTKAWNADVFVFHGVPDSGADTWWVIPREVIAATGRATGSFSLRPPDHWKHTPRWHEWIDAWHVFDQR